MKAFPLLLFIYLLPKYVDKTIFQMSFNIILLAITRAHTLASTDLIGPWQLLLMLHTTEAGATSLHR